MTAGLVALCALLGLMVGSFLNVVIWRLPRDESVVAPRSRCPDCGATIRALDNIPMISWLVLRGRCRHCSARISVRYPLVEVSTAALFALVAARFSDSWVLPAYLVLVAALIAISAIDLEHMLIPNRIVYPVGAASAVLLAAASLGEGDWPALGRAALGAVIDFGVFYGLWSMWPKAMGFGDVRHAALLGAHQGWVGWGTLGTGMFLPFLIGSIGGIVVVAPVLLAPMVGAGALGWVVGVDAMESWAGETPTDPTRARITVAFVLAVLIGSFLYLVGSFMRRIPRGRALPFGPSMAVGAVVAILLAGPAT